MKIQKFRNPLPEDRYSERERNQRIKMFNEFCEKLRKERKRAGIDDRTAIRQLLLYVRLRLDLLDHENRHARMLAQFDSLFGQFVKPVSQGPFGGVGDAVLDIGLKDRVKAIRRCEEFTESLIAEISLMAPEIDQLLDQRHNPDKENDVFRPSSCLPEVEVAIRDDDASSTSGSAPELPKYGSPDGDTTHQVPKTGEPSAGKVNLFDKATAGICRKQDQSIRPDSSQSSSPKGKIPSPNPIPQPNDESSSRDWLEPRKSTITYHGKRYRRNHLADKLMKAEGLTEIQREVAILTYGYGMSVPAISKLFNRNSKSVYCSRNGATSKMDKDPTFTVLLRNYNSRNRRSKDEDDSSWPE